MDDLLMKLLEPGDLTIFEPMMIGRAALAVVTIFLSYSFCIVRFFWCKLSFLL